MDASPEPAAERAVGVLPDLGADVEEQILPLADAREIWQRTYINRVLSLHDGNRTKTARVLDVDPRTIFRHLERERTDV